MGAMWGRALARIVLGSVCTAAGLVATVQAGELQERDEVWENGARLAQERKFAEIDRLTEAYLAQGSRTPSGLWKSGLLAGGVDEGLLRPKPSADADWDRLEAMTLEWARDRPDSALARVTHAEMIVRRGWAIRGGRYAHQVAESAWRPFHGHINRARAYLESEKRIASSNPDYYRLMLEIIKAQKGEGDPYPVLEEGIARHPGYYPMYFSMLDYLLPKWHGDESKIEKFVKQAVDATETIEGQSMYARIYWYASQSDYGDDLFYRSFAHWDRMKDGFEDVLKRYPDQWNLQNYAKFACDAQDPDALGNLIRRVEMPLLIEAWGSRERFEACERMAGQIRL
jgi:hypothetical protein